MLSAVTTVDMLSMLTLGLLGTGHCIGMCGPLVFALPGQTGRFSAHIYYHLGRLITYVVLGGLLGGIGAGLSAVAGQPASSAVSWLPLAQVALSILSAALLLLLGLARLGIVREPQWLLFIDLTKLPGHSRWGAGASGRKAPASFFITGMVLGFLPCGLSYAAFIRALPSGGCTEGMLLVLIFGLGTVPGLLLVGTGASHLFRRYRRQSDLASGMVMIGMGAWLAVRALTAVRL
jgi:sulfite exporter TauE/SafE